MATETLKISDGSSMEITRVPDLDDETWAEVKTYVEQNPETAKADHICSRVPCRHPPWYGPPGPWPRN